MSFIALVLTLCTVAHSGDNQQCNTYFIDSFAGAEQTQGVKASNVSLHDQWGDCVSSMDEETNQARNAAVLDHATRPSAKDGFSDEARKAYLSRFNIVDSVMSITSWQYSCARVNDGDMP